MLIQASSHIKSRNKSGRTPLHWAADRGAANAVKWLLLNGADARIEEFETNMTARDYAELRVREAKIWEKNDKTKVLEIFDDFVWILQPLQEDD